MKRTSQYPFCDESVSLQVRIETLKCPSTPPGGSLWPAFGVPAAVGFSPYSIFQKLAPSTPPGGSLWPAFGVPAAVGLSPYSIFQRLAPSTPPGGSLWPAFGVPAAVGLSPHSIFQKQAHGKASFPVRLFLPSAARLNARAYFQ